MPHLVKCFYCDKTFDRDKVPFIKVNARRYAHTTCSEANITNEKTKEEVEKDKFYQMIKSIYGPDYNYLLINTQAEEYMLKYGYTWSGYIGFIILIMVIKKKAMEVSESFRLFMMNVVNIIKIFIKHKRRINK